MFVNNHEAAKITAKRKARTAQTRRADHQGFGAAVGFSVSMTNLHYRAITVQWRRENTVLRILRPNQPIKMTTNQTIAVQPRMRPREARNGTLQRSMAFPSFRRVRSVHT